jgi:HAD superfamily hydrolase (TIGR01549 family)
MARLRAVILDIDGTLVYSNDEHARAFVEAARELGIAGGDFDQVRRLIGKGGDKLIPEVFGFEQESEQGEKLEERKGEIFRRRYGPHLQATPGTRELLEQLKGRGVRLVVATSAGEDDLEILLERAGVADLIDDCTSSSDVEESKPEPDVVQAAVELAKAEPGEVVMIGDTPYDVEAALRANVRIVGVRTGGWGDEDLAGAVEIHDDPAAILSALERSVLGSG